jgi:hypothetical protein
VYNAMDYTKIGCTVGRDDHKSTSIALCSRYATSLVDPYVKYLVKVNDRKKTEDAIFAALSTERVHKKHEVFKGDFDTVICPIVESIVNMQAVNV